MSTEDEILLRAKREKKLYGQVAVDTEMRAMMAGVDINELDEDEENENGGEEEGE